LIEVCGKELDPFHFNSSQRSLLTPNENCLLFGLDTVLGANPAEINAMYHAANSGPLIANAYLLGGYHHEKKCIIRPVQYYKIDKELYNELGLESNRKLLRSLSRDIKRERQG